MIPDGLLSGQYCIVFLLLTHGLAYGAACPNSCTCHNRRVSCDQGMKSFPAIMDLPHNTTDIIIGASQITTIPFGELLFKLKELKLLDVSNGQIKSIGRINVPRDSKLKVLKLSSNEITNVEPGAFDNLSRIHEIDLDHNPLLNFPVFNKTSSLQRFHLSFTAISRLSKVSLDNLPILQKLNLAGTAIRELPSGIFESNTQLLELNLEDSRDLVTIHDKAFVGPTSLQLLNLDNTAIRSLPNRGLGSLRHLSLKSVQGFWAMPDGLRSIEEVTVSRYNSFLCCAFQDGEYMARQARQQSSTGTEGVPEASSTVRPQSTTRATDTVTTAAMETTTQHPTTSQSVVTTRGNVSATTTENPWGPDNPWGRRKRDLSGFDTPTNSSVTQTTKGAGGDVVTSPTSNNGDWGGGWGGTGNDTTSPTKDSGGGGGILLTFPGGFGSRGTVAVHSTLKHETVTNKPFVMAAPAISISCSPEPDAFHPCENIMGDFWLTAVCFIVGAVAIVSNFFLLLTLLFSQRRLNVTRFLMCNLAFADLCLGLYLFILVCASIETSGKFYNYVQSWQRWGGCQVAGFLAVFSTELSVFTLLIITVERFLAIVYAMEMNTRLSYSNTVKLMINGWLFALLGATLPLLGVSSYDKVAICLPFDTASIGSKVFVMTILVINGLSFLTVAVLYGKMFAVVISPGDMQAATPQRNDTRVAKRMAVLVLTDFVCWAPIALFGILAATGTPIIDVSDSKILLVFFFPLNSCCNPFLYAFFTRGFKRDFYSALSRYGFCKERALRYSGTISSFMYSRSRKSQTQDNNTPDNRKQRISTISASSDMRTSPKYPSGDLSPRSPATADQIPMTGLANRAFSEDYSAGNGEVFFPTTPTKTANSSSPKPSALRKTSTGQKSPNTGTAKKVVISEVDKGVIPEEQCNENDGERQHKSRRNSKESIHGIEGIRLGTHL